LPSYLLQLLCQKEIRLFFNDLAEVRWREILLAAIAGRESGNACR